jgi:hypothetical protein
MMRPSRRRRSRSRRLSHFARVGCPGIVVALNLQDHPANILLRRCGGGDGIRRPAPPPVFLQLRATPSTPPRWWRLSVSSSPYATLPPVVMRSSPPAVVETTTSRIRARTRAKASSSQDRECISRDGGGEQLHEGRRHRTMGSGVGGAGRSSTTVCWTRTQWRL